MLRRLFFLTFVAAAAAFPAQADEWEDLDKRVDALREAGKSEQAVPVVERMLKVAEASGDQWRVGASYNAMGLVYEDQEKYDEAQPYYEKTIETWEANLGADHANVGVAVNNLANIHYNMERYADAEPLYDRVLRIRETNLGAEHADVAAALSNLGAAYYHQGKYAEAEAPYQRALEINRKLLAADDVALAGDLDNLANDYYYLRRYAEAEPLYQEALQLREKALEQDDPQIAVSLCNLADLYCARRDHIQAEPIYLRAIAIREKALGPDDEAVLLIALALGDVYTERGKHADAQRLFQRVVESRKKTLGVEATLYADALIALANCYGYQGKYAPAEPLYAEALRITEQALGADHADVAWALSSFANHYIAQGKLTIAEPLVRRALAITENVYGPDDVALADCIRGVANLYCHQGKLVEAEPYYQRALQILENSLAEGDIKVAGVLNDLASLYSSQGRLAAAEPLHQRALRITEQALGSEHRDVADSLEYLGDLYLTQGKYAEAEPLFRRSLAIWEKSVGPTHVAVATSLHGVALACHRQNKFAEAEPLYRRAVQLREKGFGVDHPDVALPLHHLAVLYCDQQRFAEAQALGERALRLVEQAYGPEHVNVALMAVDLADIYRQQQKFAEAEPLVDRAVAIYDRTKAFPDWQFRCYLLRARLGWQANRRDEALADLRRAMDLAEQIRGQGSGGEQDRAQLFGSYASAFELMLDWQVTLGSAGEALTAIERGRARSLLDELNMSGRDLNAGRTALEREQLTQIEFELKSNVALLEKQLAALPADAADQRVELEKQMAAARDALFQHHREARSNNPVYRNLLSVGAAPLRLSQLQRALVGQDGLMLAYWAGEKNSYVLAISADEVSLHRIEVDAALAGPLELKAGPLTADQLSIILTRDKKTGILQQLINPKAAADQAAPKLAALWRVLVPEKQRTALLAGRYKRLIVIPDGPLALLPFETLVVEEGRRPKYLLEAGPPILYGPSATVLYNLSQRPQAAKQPEMEVLLSVADPDYRGTAAQASDNGAMTDLAARSRYGALGGRLTPLPYSATEADWVSQAFAKVGLAAGRLSKAEATEQAVRAGVPGRRIVHLACHGLTDQSYGNFFGALALTPGTGEESDAANDGFLTLGEIYELNLKDCELAILSACETNYGPQQRGEGVWALSRGFLVAGSRRVVASNWLVDDEAAASLISYFCSSVAQQEKKGGPVDYAEALHAAKRWVRQQPKWSHPYYWATFTLVGPQ